MLIATVIAGAYPFISLLKINPVASLKGQVMMRSSLVRRSLLTFQFVASLTLMALVATALFQLDFMRQVNINFDTSRKQITLIAQIKVPDHKNFSGFYFVKPIGYIYL